MFQANTSPATRSSLTAGRAAARRQFLFICEAADGGCDLEADAHGKCAELRCTRDKTEAGESQLHAVFSYEHANVRACALAEIKRAGCCPEGGWPAQ
eukprot:6576059-Pyramimonas_sp.AAC.1